MQYSVILFFLASFLSACVFALPTASSAEGGVSGRFLARSLRRLEERQDNTQAGASQGQNNTAAAGGRNGVSDTQVMNAVMSWMADTAKVTKFLNSATSFTGAEFTKQATIALNAEIDELNHKMVLDAALTGMDMVAQANNVLATQGTFQQVVDTLQSMVTNGPDTAQKDVTAINNNRCVNVLPNIDMYFAAAGAPQIQAVRPTGCLEVDGANVTPAVPPPAGNNGGAAAPPPAAPQVTAAPANNAPPANNNGNGNGNQNQNQNQNQGGNDGGNIGKGIGNNNNNGNGNGQNQNQNQNNGQNQGNNNQNQNQNQNQGNSGNGNQNQNQGNNNQNQNQGNGNGNQNQNQGNGNNQNQGNGDQNQNQNQNQNQGNNQGNNQNNAQPQNTGGQSTNGNQNNGSGRNNGNGNGNGLQPATVGSSNNGGGARPNSSNNGGNNNNNNNQGQRQQNTQKQGGNTLQPAQIGSPRPAN